MISRFISFVNDHRLIVPGDHICVAASGGLDSTALLHLLYLTRGQLGIHLSAIHVNHAVRGAESDKDEAFVRDLCARLNIPLTVRRLAGLTPDSSEQTMRDLRYREFDRLLAENPGAKIATGHHLDDQMETVLMRMARGSYVTGLKGIPVKRPGYIRPLLFARRCELRQFLTERKLSFRVDQTNRDPDKTRNRVRHILMPALRETFGPAFDAGFLKTIDHFARIDEFLTQHDKHWLEQNGRIRREEIAFSLNAFSGLPEWRQRRVIMYCIWLLNPLNSMLSAETLRGFRQFAAKARTGGRFYFPGGVEALLDRGTVLLSRASSGTEELRKELFPGQVVSLKRNKIRAELVSFKDVVFSNRKDEEYICGDRLRWPLAIRHWQAGDYFFPLGVHGRQKISDFLINQKVNLREKKQTLVLLNGSDVVWLIGRRLDERYAVSESCQTVYRLKIEKEEGDIR